MISPKKILGTIGIVVIIGFGLLKPEPAQAIFGIGDIVIDVKALVDRIVENLRHNALKIAERALVKIIVRHIREKIADSGLCGPNFVTDWNAYAARNQDIGREIGLQLIGEAAFGPENDATKATLCSDFAAAVARAVGARPVGNDFAKISGRFRTGSARDFKTENQCTLPKKIIVDGIERDFDLREAVANDYPLPDDIFLKLFESQNSFAGVLLNSIGEIDKQTAGHENSALQEALAGNGFLSLRTPGGYIKTPGKILQGAASSIIDSTLKCFDAAVRFIDLGNCVAMNIRGFIDNVGDVADNVEDALANKDAVDAFGNRVANSALSSLIGGSGGGASYGYGSCKLTRPKKSPETTDDTLDCGAQYALCENTSNRACDEISPDDASSIIKQAAQLAQYRVECKLEMQKNCLETVNACKTAVAEVADSEENASTVPGGVPTNPFACLDNLGAKPASKPVNFFVAGPISGSEQYDQNTIHIDGFEPFRFYREVVVNLDVFIPTMRGGDIFETGVNPREAPSYYTGQLKFAIDGRDFRGTFLDATMFLGDNQYYKELPTDWTSGNNFHIETRFNAEQNTFYLKVTDKDTGQVKGEATTDDAKRSPDFAMPTELYFNPFGTAEWKFSNIEIRMEPGGPYHGGIPVKCAQ